MKVSFVVSAEAALFSLSECQNRVQTRRQEATRRVAELALNRVVARNPVLTGRSRAGWVSGGQELNLSVQGSWQGGDAGAMQKGASAGSGQMTEEEFRTRYEVENRVEYVPLLEYGSSRMAARAMVRAALQETAFDGPALMGEVLFP